MHRLRRVGHHGLRIVTIATIIAIAMIAMGFFRFTDTIAETEAQGCANARRRVDAIVAAQTRRWYQRIDPPGPGPDLEDGVGQRLLDFRRSIHRLSSTALRRATGTKKATFGLLRRHRLRGARHHRQRQ